MQTLATTKPTELRATLDKVSIIFSDKFLKNHANALPAVVSCSCCKADAPLFANRQTPVYECHKCGHSHSAMWYMPLSLAIN